MESNINSFIVLSRCSLPVQISLSYCSILLSFRKLPSSSTFLLPNPFLHYSILSLYSWRVTWSDYLSFFSLFYFPSRSWKRLTEVFAHNHLQTPHKNATLSPHLPTTSDPALTPELFSTLQCPLPLPLYCLAPGQIHSLWHFFNSPCSPSGCQTADGLPFVVHHHLPHFPLTPSYISQKLWWMGCNWFFFGYYISTTYIDCPHPFRIVHFHPSQGFYTYCPLMNNTLSKWPTQTQPHAFAFEHCTYK